MMSITLWPFSCALALLDSLQTDLYAIARLLLQTSAVFGIAEGVVTRDFGLQTALISAPIVPGYAVRLKRRVPRHVLQDTSPQGAEPGLQPIGKRGSSPRPAGRGLVSPGLPKERIGPHLEADHGLQCRARQTGLASGDITPELGGH